MVLAAAGLNFVEWGFLGLYFVAVLAIGLYIVRRSSKSTGTLSAVVSLLEGLDELFPVNVMGSRRLP